MRRKPFGLSYRDPRRANNFLDSCAFDPKYLPEDEAARLLRAIGKEGKVNLIITHSNQKEIDHPNTPSDVKREASAMQFTLEKQLSPAERDRKVAIHVILTGNGKPEKYAADSAHVFEAGKYVGYFVTTDERILAKKAELERVSGAVILKPTEWLQIFEEVCA